MALEPMGAAIELVSPQEDEEWSAESLHYVLWNAGEGATDRRVKIEFTPDAGQSWQTITEEAPNTGRFLWAVPDCVSAQCRVRVSDPKLGLTAESAIFSIIPSQKVRNYRWVNVTMEAAWAPRDGAGALVYEGKMWLLGGWNPGDKVHFPRICNNEVWSSADGADWKLVKPNTFLDESFDPASDWEGRHTAGYVVHEGKMWIVGGDANQRHYQNDVWNSTDGARWTLVTDEVPWAPRVLHCTIAFQGKIWVLGGQTLPQFAPWPEVIFYDDIWNTTDGVNWTKVTPQEPHWCPRGMIGFSAVFKDRMWILGGGTYDTPEFPDRKFFNDVWSSPDGVHWEQHVACAPWPPRQYHEVAVFDGRLWVLEGYHQDSGNRNDVWYSADGVNWYELPDTPWKPRHAASVFVFDNALWMVGGNNMEPDVWKLQRASAEAE